MFLSGSLFLVRILLGAFLLRSIFALRCFCGYGGICQVDTHGGSVPENCSRCGDMSGSLYESDCRTLASLCTSTTCQNGGTCVPVLGATFCKCRPNYFDVDCSKFSRANNITERLSSPVIYYPLHASINEKRNIYLGVKDFGDDFVATITFNKVSSYYRLSEFDFDWMNLKPICLDRVERIGTIEDPAVCELLPNEDIRAVAIPHKIFAAMNFSVEIKMDFSSGRRIGAFIDEVDIVFSNGPYPTFEQSYKLISSISELDFLCMHRIVLYGCSDTREIPVLIQAQDDINIESIVHKEDELCHPVRIWSQKWYHMTIRKLQEVEDSINSRFLKIPGRTLQEGVHEVQFEYTIMADPPLYGTNTTLTSTGICWFRVNEGPLRIAIEGGDVQTVPCNTPFTLKVNNLNPNHHISDMNFTWTCNNTSDKRCLPQHTQGFQDYPARTIGCGSAYTFAVVVTYFLNRDSQISHTRVLFRAENHKLSIRCIKNCQPGINVVLPSLLYVVSEPFFQGSFSWDLLDANRTIMDRDEQILKQTKFGEFLFFESEYFEREPGPRNLTVVVTKGKAKAEIMLNVRGRPKDPQCGITQSFEEFPPVWVIKCTPSDDEGVYYVFEKDDGFYNAVFRSTSGEYPQVGFTFEYIVVYFVNLMGDPSFQNLHSGIENVINAAGDTAENRLVLKALARKEIESYMADGEYPVVLRLLSMMAFYLLDKPKWIDDDANSSSSEIMNYVLSIYNKVPYNEMDMRMVTAMTFVQKLSNYVEDREILASENKYYISKGLRENSAIAVRKSKDSDWAIGTLLQDFRIIHEIVGPHISGLARRDKLFDRAEDHFDPWLYQQMLRLNEKASLNFLESLNDVRLMYAASLTPFAEALTDDDTADRRTFYFWVYIGTPDIIMKTYEKDHLDLSDPQRSSCIAIGNHTSMKTGERLAETYISFQVYRLQMDVLWWHRYETVHTEVIYTSLFRINDYREPPPSRVPFEIKLRVLPKYYDLLEGTFLNGTTSISVDEDRDYRIAKYSFSVGRGTNNIHFEFVRCTSRFGCRLIILRHVPAYEDFFEKSQRRGIFATSNGERVNLKHYVGVLPGKEETPGKKVDFSLRFRTAECKSWQDVGKMTSRCQFDRFEDTTMIANTTRPTWFAMTIKHLVFKPVFHLNIELVVPILTHYFVLYVVLITLIVFVVSLIWAILKDLREVDKRRVVEIARVAPYQSFPYAIGVFTGMSLCNTTSNVAIRLVGNTFGSIGLIKRPGWSTLETASDDWFILYTRDSLGELQEIELWHDNSGFYPDWYCDSVIAVDLIENAAYIFPIRKLLTVARSDNDEARITTKTAQILPGYEDAIRARGNLFWQTLRSQMMNKHLYLSIIYLHHRNTYRRFDCLLLLWSHIMAMLSGALIFWDSDTLPDVDGRLRITWAEWIEVIIIGIVAAYVNTILLTYLFRRGHRNLELSNNYSDHVARRITRANSTKRYTVTKPRSSSNFRPSSNPRRSEMFKDGPENYYGRRLSVFVTNSSKKRITYYLSHIFFPTSYVRFEKSGKSSRKKITKKCFTVERDVVSSVIVIYIILLVILGLNVQKSVGIKWITTSLAGILIDFIIVQTLFCVVNSWVLVSFMKKTDMEMVSFRFDVPVSHFEKLHGGECMQFIKEGSQRAYKPLLSTVVEKQRRVREKTKFILLIFVVVLCASVLAFIAFYTRGFSINLRFHLIKPMKTLYSDTKPSVGRIFSEEDIEHFIGKVFLTSTNTGTWYNGLHINGTFIKESVLFEKKIYNETKAWMPDRISILLGDIRLLQHRITNRTINFPRSFKGIVKAAYPPILDWTSNLDNKDYCEGWTNTSGCYPRSRKWIYSSKDESSHEFFYWKGIRTYTSSGYTRIVHWGSRVSVMTLVNLFTDNWLDTRTRAVVLEFNIYNRFVDGATSGGFLLEVDSSGGVASRLILESAVVNAVPEFMDYSLETVHGTFTNLAAPIRTKQSLTLFFPVFIGIIITMLMCYILTRLSNKFKKSTLGLVLGLRMVLKFTLIAVYIHMLYWYNSLIWEHLSTELDVITLNDLVQWCVKIPITASFCVGAFILTKKPRIQRRPVRSTPVTMEDTEPRFPLTVNYLKTVSLYQQRLTRIDMKFARIKS